MHATNIIKGIEVWSITKDISFIGIGYVAYIFYGLFAEIRIKEQNYRVLESTMTECSVWWSFLFDKLHGKLDRFGRFDVTPDGLFLVINPFAGGLNYTRNVFIAIASFHRVIKSHTFVSWSAWLRLFHFLILNYFLFWPLLLHRYLGLWLNMHLELVFFLTINRFITLPAFLFFRFPLNELKQFFPFPQKIGIFEAMNSAVFHFGEAVHIELNGITSTCRMKDW